MCLQTVFFFSKTHICNLHPPHNLDAMEADTLYNTTDGNEMDADDVCQMDPDQYNSRAPDTSVYVGDICTPPLCATANMFVFFNRLSLMVSPWLRTLQSVLRSR